MRRDGKKWSEIVAAVNRDGGVGGRAEGAIKMHYSHSIQYSDVLRGLNEEQVKTSSRVFWGNGVVTAVTKLCTGRKTCCCRQRRQ